MFDYGLHSDEVDEILSHLITEGFLNEERFAKSFASGKFRILKWGRNKIEHELQLEGLTPRCIALGLTTIDTDDYFITLKNLVKKKLFQSTEKDDFKKKNKIARFVIAKGYEPEQVWEIVNENVK